MHMPKPGDIGLVSSRAWTGRFVRVAQALIGDKSIVTHTFLVLTNGYIIEAEPGGAKFSRLDKYPDATFSNIPLTENERYDICEAGIRMEGVPYSFLDYIALGLTHINICAEPVRRRVESSGKMICSQLCAEAYRQAGVELFPDKRLPMDVTPGDIHRLVDQLQGLDKPTRVW